MKKKNIFFLILIVVVITASFLRVNKSGVNKAESLHESEL
ncbi:gamma-glutamylcyclotransferase, partial [Francisella tularensis subsp. holarctica]|nr:gamma-glutamylcyclotransferase [Francisella tularensis subsp. holarctica]